MALRIVYMGTPDFAVPALKALIESPLTQVVGVFSQPPRPTGRGYHVLPSPVQHLAESHGIPVWTPKSLKDPQVQAELTALCPDWIVVAAYGLILPAAVLSCPTYGCLNIHASLLPRWRGASPIQQAILHGDAVSGVTIMGMAAGLDTGPIYQTAIVPLTPQMTAQELHDVLAQQGADLLLEVLQHSIANPITPTPQNDAEAVYAPKLTKEDAWIDWHQSSIAIDQQIRAFDPWPGTVTCWEGQTLKVLKARPLAEPTSAAPGTILSLDLRIACGSGQLQLLEVQLPGKKVIPAASLHLGHAVTVGQILGKPCSVSN